MQRIFNFVGYSFDSQNYVLNLEYNYSNLDFNFIEKLDFSNFKGFHFDLDELSNVFEIIFLVFGISYYKLYASGEINLGDLVLSSKQAEFLNFFYKNGLSEFIFKNELDWEKNIPNFDAFIDLEVEKIPSNKVLSDKSLLAWGGGKDSIVSSIILDRLELDYDLFCVQSDKIKKNTANVNGRNLLEVKRQMDCRLFDLNKLDDTFNGHVPITGMLAFVKVLIAMLCGYSNVVLSNEYSASQGNLVYKNEKVNHQFSKDFEFEQRICSYIKSFIHSDLIYFSLLRPFYELKISKIFAENGSEYFSCFSSCNRNFHIDSNKKLQGNNFCAECEKCAFVFLILAPFISKSQLLHIFGKNMLDDAENVYLYKALVGLTDKKPFECVGTFEESQAAFELLFDSLNWNDSLVVLEMNKYNFSVNVDQFLLLEKDYNFSTELYNQLQDEF